MKQTSPLEVGIPVIDFDLMYDFYTNVLSCTETRRMRSECRWAISQFNFLIGAHSCPPYTKQCDITIAVLRMDICQLNHLSS